MAEWAGRLHLYALLNPRLEGVGWNSAERRLIAGKTILMSWHNRTHLVMGTNNGFIRTSCGYVGMSDGWQDLRDNFRLDWEFERAENGNVAVIGEIDVSTANEFILGLSFGEGAHAASCTLLQGLSTPFSLQLERFTSQWHRVCCNILDLDQYSGDAGRLYRLSYNLLLSHEDKTYTGAFIASASIPWGEAKGEEDLGGYHLVWTRDLVNTATALLACDNTEIPRRALVYLASSQQGDGGFPQNFWLDGTPYWRGVQLDEVAYPAVLAWRLWKCDALGGFDPYPMVKAAARFLIQHGPATEQERWEENSGYSPSTLAITIAAIVCAADMFRARGEQTAAKFLEDSADFLESHIERWTVTTSGTLVPGIPKHYIRIHPVGIGDYSPIEDPNTGLLPLANQPPGVNRYIPAKDVVDAGFLELVRYGIRRPQDPLVRQSLEVVDSVLRINTPAGPGWRRYNHDGYGQQEDGSPYVGWGKGHAWPLLTGERAHYELAAGRDVKPLVSAIENFASSGGMLPEQIWDQPDLPHAKMIFGRPTGSAMPLIWAHAEYIKLLRSIADRKVFDSIEIVVDRYLKQKGRKDLEIWKPIRQVREVCPGQTLRVQAPRPFRLHWSADEWQTVYDTTATHTILGIAFVDISIRSAQLAPIRFTFFWTDEQHWEGRDYEVRIQSAAALS